MGRRQILAGVMFVLGQCASAGAQQKSSMGFTIAYETTHDRFHYRFENPSSFSTTEPVPHEFTQTYWGDNQWLVLRGRFDAGAHFSETEFAATPQRSVRGDDYDTFFQPSGDIVVAGTTGNVSMRSLRIRQTVGLGHKAGLDWNAGYQYRRDRSVFGPGYKTITHTQPISLESSIIYTRETTVSQIYGLAIGATKRWNRDAWSVAVGIDAAPAMRARLLTLLPDKYPGVDIVFSALANEVRPSISASFGRHYPISVTAAYTRSTRYKSSARFERTAASVEVGIGWSAR